MLLQRLVDFRPIENGDNHDGLLPYHRERTVRWELDITTNPPSAYLHDLADGADPATKFGRAKIVPNVSRTSGIAPAMGADDIQYVLGWADEKSNADRVASAHAAFVELARRWRRSQPHDAIAKGVVDFYDGSGASSVIRPDRWSSKDLVIIKVDGRTVTEADSLWAMWKTVVEERKSGSADGDHVRYGLCLVCGQTAVLLNRMPQALPKALVPRAEQEIALISANKRIHTYDFSDGLATAPICVDCGQAAVANLHTLLSDDKHTFTYDRQRTRLAWWVTNGGDAESIAMLDAKPSLISDYLRRVGTGRQPQPIRDHEFCAVTISGNVARLVVHDLVQMPLAETESNVQRWFEDHAIASRWEDRPAVFPVWLLITCAGQWLPGRDGAHGRYVPLYDKAADRPDDLAHLLWRAALSGAPLPPYVLGHVVRRVRKDLCTDEPRAALLRLALTRLPHLSSEAPMPALDESRADPAYLCGRLFAALEALQRRAYGKQDLPNTTFYHRFYAGAVANPRIALIQGEQLSAAWLKKLEGAARRDHPEATRDGYAARAHQRRIRDLIDRLASPFPTRISTEDQAWFILGYHHQRAHDLARARQAKGADADLFVADIAEPTIPNEQEANNR